MHEPYRRRLPHIFPPGETLFITYRLHGTLPRYILSELQAEHERFITNQINNHPDERVDTIKKRWEGRYFLAIDSFLDIATEGADHLANNAISEIVKESIHFRDERQFELHAYCIMPNHVHILVTNIREEVPFHRVLGSMKANSAKKANEYLGLSGQPFWQEESYDHVVRNGKSFERIIDYILNNPVKAGLARHWQEWPYTYCKYDWQK